MAGVLNVTTQGTERQYPDLVVVFSGEITIIVIIIISIKCH